MTPWSVTDRLLCTWNFAGKNTGVGCHFLLQGIFLIWGSYTHLLHILHWQASSFSLSHLGSPGYIIHSVSQCSRVYHHFLFNIKHKFLSSGKIPCIGLHCWLSGKESTCQAGDVDLIPGSGRFPGVGNGNPLQYSCLGNHMDRGAWGLQSMGLQKSWTQLNH